MSGGSYNYLFQAEAGELFEFGRRDRLADMRDRLTGLGYPDVAARVAAIIAAMGDYERQVDALMSPVKDVMQAVEWLDSNDYEEDQVREAVVEYRDAVAEPTEEPA